MLAAEARSSFSPWCWGCELEAAPIGPDKAEVGGWDTVGCVLVQAPGPTPSPAREPVAQNSTGDQSPVHAWTPWKRATWHIAQHPVNFPEMYLYQFPVGPQLDCLSVSRGLEVE